MKYLAWIITWLVFQGGGTVHANNLVGGFVTTATHTSYVVAMPTMYQHQNQMPAAGINRMHPAVPFMLIPGQHMANIERHDAFRSIDPAQQQPDIYNNIQATSLPQESHHMTYNNGYHANRGNSQHIVYREMQHVPRDQIMHMQINHMRRVFRRGKECAKRQYLKNMNEMMMSTVPPPAHKPEVITRIVESHHHVQPPSPPVVIVDRPKESTVGISMEAAVSNHTMNVQESTVRSMNAFPPPQPQPQPQSQPLPPQPQPQQIPLQPSVATSQTCSFPPSASPEELEQGLALAELLRSFGPEQATNLIHQLYPQTAPIIVQDYQQWQYSALEPYLQNALQPALNSDRSIPCPPLNSNGLHSAWLLAALRSRFGFEASQALAHRLFGMAAVHQLVAAEAWRQNVLNPWMEVVHPSPQALEMQAARHRHAMIQARMHDVQLRVERQQVRRMRRFYEGWMMKERRLLKVRKYRQFMHHMLGRRYHRFLDKNHSPYYLFLSRQMRRWVTNQYRRTQMEALHRLHHWRLRNDPRYYRRHHYIRGIFPVLRSILTSRRQYWKWHRRMHGRVLRAYRWRRMLNRMRRFYPHHHIPFRLLNRSYLCYVQWARKMSPFDIRNPLNPFNPFFGFGAPQSRCFRRWVRSMRRLPRWYWRAYPMRHRLPIGFKRWPSFWRSLPRFRMRPWYLRAPWKFDPRFNPYWPYFHRPRLPRLPWPLRWPRFHRPRFGRISLPRFRPRWPFRRPRMFRMPFWRRPYWPRFHRPRWWGWRPRFRYPRFRLPRFRFPRFRWPRFRNPFRSYGYYY